jgi:hypothetical protein
MVKPSYFSLRPRYLRAIPSLVVLTTAMAWGVASDPDVLDVATRRADVTLVQGAAAGGRPDAMPFFRPKKP